MPGTLQRSLVLVAAGILVYWNALSNPFVFDDFGAIVNNPTIRQVSAATLSPPDGTPVAGRPLANLSFAVSYQLGGMNADGFRAVNLAIHIGCALLIMLLVQSAIFAVRGSEQRQVEWVAFAVALVWLVHPINSEPVDYLTQRTESLMALCCLIAVYCAARSASAVKPRAGKRDVAAPRLWQAAAVAATIAGVLAKETIAVVPMIVVAWDRAFVFPSMRDAFRARWRFYAALCFVWLVVSFNVWRGGQTVSAGFASAGVSPWIYLLNQPAIILNYLKLMFWPVPLVSYYGWPLRDVTLASVSLGGSVIIALLTVSAFAVWKWPRAGFAAIWFWLTLAPPSSIVPIATEVGAERRMYLPSAALIALVIVGAVWLIKRYKVSSQAAVGVLFVVVALLSWRTFERNREYGSALQLAETTLERWPTANAHHLVGVELAASGRHEEAVMHLRESARTYPMSHFYLGSEYLTLKRLDDAIAELQAFVAAEPLLVATTQARMMMAQAYVAKQDLQSAMEQARLVLAASPNHADANGMMANLLADQQDFVAAVPHYQRFLASRPNNAAAWTGLGVALIEAGDRRTAIAAFQRAADLEPGNPQYQNNLARAISGR